MNDLDLHYAALIAYILNPKLSRHTALAAMGIKEKQEIREIIQDRTSRIIIKPTEAPKIKHLYEVEHKTVIELSKMYEVSQGTISNFFKNNGIEGKGRGYRRVVEC